MFLQSNNLSVGALMELATNSLTIATTDFFCVARFRQQFLRANFESSKNSGDSRVTKSLRKIEALVKKVSDSIQELPNLMFQYSTSLPAGHSDKQNATVAAMALLDYVNKIVSFEFAPQEMVSFRNSGEISRDLSEKRKHSLDHFGLFFSEKCKLLLN